MKRLGLFLGPIILINVNGYFEPCLQALSQCITDGFMDERHRAMWSVVSEPEAVFQTIQDAPEWKPNARAFAIQR
jgi:predicted Rossmann-fold nucleotide-binding protein